VKAKFLPWSGVLQSQPPKRVPFGCIMGAVRVAPVSLECRCLRARYQNPCQTAARVFTCDTEPAPPRLPHRAVRPHARFGVSGRWHELRALRLPHTFATRQLIATKPTWLTCSDYAAFEPTLATEVRARDRRASASRMLSKL
jgi:hypothetical protein